MALLTCGGADVLEGVLHLPARGAWWSSLQLDTATAPSGKITLAASGGLSLSGTVLTAGVFCDVARMQLVGGAGGLRTILTPAAFESAQLRDPFDSIMRMSGESRSASVDAALLAVVLPQWTLVASTAARALDELAGVAASALGKDITWRVLSDGTIWMGAESWPSKTMPKGSDLLFAFPDDGRFIIGPDTPWLLPGVALAGVGNVRAVDHFFDAHEVRSWAWV